MERLGLYLSTQFKNGSGMKKCFMQEKLVKPEIPDLSEKHTEFGSIIWVR